MADEKVKSEELTKILIEPVFENKDLINVRPELKGMAYHLVTQSAVLSSFSVRAEHCDGELISQFRLKNIKLTDRRTYEQTFGENYDLEFELKKPKDSQT